MEVHYKRMALALPAILLPLLTLAATGPYRENLSTQIMVISVFNTLLFATSVISIIQFVWHGGHNRTPFQIFNILFAVAFYSISLSFLIQHKAYFEGYENLSDKNAITKYFLDKDILSWLKLLIPVAVLLNIVYVLRFARSYYLE